MKRRNEPMPSNQKTLSGFLKQFRNDEDGSLIYFGLICFVLILMFGGMAVDLMRYETTRAKLQGTLDRAVLAAADLDQTLPPSEVVTDYFEKAGMIEYLDSTEVSEGINFRVVTATADADMPLFFYDLPRVFMSPFSPHVTALNVSGASTAEERVTDVEVSLILDVSGSMGGSRIANLRPAAREFVTTVLSNNTNAPQGLITISMIPYSAVVNPGSSIEPVLNINRTHNYSTCPLFPTSMFSTTRLELGMTFDHVAHFDPDWYWDSDDHQPIKYPWCHVGDHNSIIVHSTNEDQLHDAIDDLQPYGNTAIDMGMKWGVGLLDDSTRPIVSRLAGVTDTGVPAIAQGRPELHTTPNVLKVVVLMTDGNNTYQYDLKEPFKTGMSPVWFDRDDNNQSIADVDFNETSVQYAGESTSSRWDDWFYWNGFGSSSRYQRYPNGFANRDAYINAPVIGPFNGDDYNDAQGDPYNDDAVGDEIVGRGDHYPSHVYNASWQDLYATRVHNEINNYYFRRPYNHGAWSYSEYLASDNAIDYNVVTSSQADDRLSTLCAAARAKGIIIYTVAFEAPSGGRDALQDCASSDTHYFDVAGTDISAAFSAIASDIRALKLTQ